MCGIAGFYDLKGDKKSNIVRMLDRLKHRGPDGSGIWIEPQETGVTLGHRRLSIIDLSENGAQPMVSHSGRFVIAYNGEIYNYSNVLEEMRNSGYTDVMTGTSDTEVLLEALEFYGPEEAIRKCRGMFAIALYDRQERELTLIRDRIGEKPLYYGKVGDGFAFASELDAIALLPGFSREINTDIIETYLKYGYIPAPHSIYRNVYKLEPGSILKINFKINNIADINPEMSHKYWDIEEKAVYGQQHKFTGTEEEAAAELERLLRTSIRGQMVADVPLGAFLSAGIDSPTVVSLMQSESSIPVRTFTIGFEDREYNEADAAAEIAAHLGTDHTQLYVTKQDALDVIPKLPDMFGEPFADSSQIPTYLVSRMTREHVTVSLSGDGGDELFAGYRDYTGVNGIYNKIKNIPVPLRKACGGTMKLMGSAAGRDSLKAHGVLMGASDAADLYRRTYETTGLYRKLAGPAVLTDAAGKAYGRLCAYDGFDAGLMGDDAIHTAMLMNMEMYHPDDILVKVDRTAMAVSLETRVPMLDRDVVEFAWTLPTEYLRDGNTGKKILRNILYKYVPKKMMDRPKKGFAVPISRWLKENELREWAEQLLNQDTINKHNMLDAQAVSRMWNDYIAKDVWRPQIWYALMLQSWLEQPKAEN